MASKIIAQLVIAGATIFGRAFLQAYQQAVVNGGKRAGQQAAQQAQKGASSAVSNLTRQTGISAEEAAQILNVDLKQLLTQLNSDSKKPLEQIGSRYQHLFKANDVKQSSGSYYLQSKVVRAKERLEMELKQQEKQYQNSERVDK